MLLIFFNIQTSVLVGFLDLSKKKKKIDIGYFYTVICPSLVRRNEN